MDIIKVSNLNQIISFINSSSDNIASYIYKLHSSNDDVEQLLNASINTTGVFCLIEDDSIVALITGILYEEDKYKVIGPFVKTDFDFTEAHFISLFSALRDEQSANATFNFSYNDCSQNSKPLMKTIHANYNFTDYYLNVYQSLNESDAEMNIIEYQPGFQRAFSKLHAQTFRHNALTPKEIVNTLDEYNRLFLFVSEGLLKGYLYLQIDSQSSLAEIRYFSSHTDYRLKGIAFDLLSYAIHYAFEHYAVNKVYFKIRSKNAALVERFNELGFEIESEYTKYKIDPSQLHH
ncbi:GNAT family N-acetyltransferase [Staphylococcus sp. GDX8P80P]|uniref:GNAT family N-acetyltransferase n=1 Tax=Staphylococcus sp. GDX8P80P TaxID=2804104 RepID=UPI001AEC4ECC|nr:GNAT family N-acetyltransferase [Staphylococcus sp. GDX8P80P]